VLLPAVDRAYTRFRLRTRTFLKHHLHHPHHHQLFRLYTRDTTQTSVLREGLERFSWLPRVDMSRSNSDIGPRPMMVRWWCGIATRSNAPILTSLIGGLYYSCTSKSSGAYVCCTAAISVWYLSDMRRFKGKVLDVSNIIEMPLFT
jgi:hypothetical protein